MSFVAECVTFVAIVWIPALLALWWSERLYRANMAKLFQNREREKHE